MKRYGTIRLSPRCHAIIEFIGDGDSTWVGGPFEHWRIVGAKCSGREVRERLKALIGAQQGGPRPSNPASGDGEGAAATVGTQTPDV